MILAKGWYDFYLKKNKYKDIKSNNFAYINVRIDVHEDNFLDLESLIIKDKIEEVVFSKKLNRKISEEEITALYSCFIEKLEKELGAKFEVWQLRVNAPYTAKDYPLSALGNPVSYVVKNNNSISILDYCIEEKKNEKKI